MDELRWILTLVTIVHAFRCGICADQTLQLSVLPDSPVIARDTLTITCHVDGDDGDKVYSVSVYVSSGDKRRLVVNVDRDEPQWGSEELRSRGEVSLLGDRNGSVTVRLDPVECEDGGVYTFVQQSSAGPAESPGVNVSLLAIPSSLTMKMASDGMEDKWKAFPGQKITLTCSGILGLPPGEITWLRFQTKDGDFVPFSANQTTSHRLEDDCKVIGSSSIVYYPNKLDENLQFRCGVRNLVSEGLINDTRTIQVQGLRKKLKQKYPRNYQDDEQEGMNTGTIVGIVFGVLVVVLFVIGLVSASAILWSRHVKSKNGSDDNAEEEENSREESPVKSHELVTSNHDLQQTVNPEHDVDGGHVDFIALPVCHDMAKPGLAKNGTEKPELCNDMDFGSAV